MALKKFIFKFKKNYNKLFLSLYLNGTSLPIRSINNSNNNEDYSFLEEEIFEQDGTYEELLAYDNQEEEYLFEHNKIRLDCAREE